MNSRDQIPKLFSSRSEFIALKPKSATPKAAPACFNMR
jgi:hypothetical protein